MWTNKIALGLVVAGLALGGCSSDSPKTSDGGGTKLDKGGTTGDLPPAAKPVCKADGTDCNDYVASKLIMPTSDPNKYALQIDNKPYNALGAILGALGNMVADMQGSVDAALNEGGTIVLLRLQPTTGLGQTWLGAKAACCPTAAGDKVKCATESKTTCFSETTPFEFAIDPKSPTDAVLSGKITSTSVNMNAPKLSLSLQLTTAGTLNLNLKTVQIRGTISGNTIKDGVLAGALDKSEVDNSLIPTVATMLDSTVKDPKVAQSTKQPIIDLFDKDPKDGTISVKEVQDNPIIKTFLVGDVDADKDGKPDLSLGIGFEAVRAKIKP